MGTHGLALSRRSGRDTTWKISTTVGIGEIVLVKAKNEEGIVTKVHPPTSAAA
jgi:hypothetical protein